MAEPILEVRNLCKRFNTNTGIFNTKKGTVNAVNNISFKTGKGEIYAVAGESGSGKSTLAKMIVQLLKPDSGDIFFEGVNISGLNKRKFRKIRPSIQMIFQNPFDCFDPRQKMKYQLLEGMEEHCLFNGHSERINRLFELLHDCGLHENDLNKYQNEFSGGELQRLSIVRALSLSPRLIIADEVLSALDISVQEQILELFISLKDKYGLSMLFISHDLAVLKNIADSIIIMRKGEIVEKGSSSDIFEHPQHCYTKQLLSSMIHFKINKRQVL